MLRSFRLENHFLNRRKYLLQSLKMAGFGATATLLLESKSAHALSDGLQLSGSFGRETHHSQNLQTFVNRVETLSSNELQIQLSFNAELMPMSNLLGALNQGHLAMGEMRMASYAKYFPILALDDIPFLTRNFSEAVLLWILGKELVIKELKQKGLRLLYTTPWSAQGLFSRSLIHKVSDLKKQKIWVRNDATQHLTDLWQAVPVQIPVNELPTAIANGQIDVMLASSLTAIEGQAWKGLRYFYDVYAWIPKNMVCISERIWNTLQPNAKKALTTAAIEAEKNGWLLAQMVDDDARKILKKHNIKMLQPSYDLRTALDAMSEKLSQEWAKSTNLESAIILSDYFQRRTRPH